MFTVWTGLLLGSAFRYGAVELARVVKLLEKLPGAVVSCVGAGHSLAHCCGSFLDLGTHACGTVWPFLHRALADLAPHGFHL